MYMKDIHCKMFSRNTVSVDENEMVRVPKYLVSPPDKVNVIVVMAELKGNKFVYTIPLVKRRAFTLNRFRNLM